MVDMPTTPPAVRSTAHTRPDAAFAAEPLRRLAVVALIETATLLLLVGIAVPLKHFANWPIGVRVLGPVHGLVFVAYLWTVIETVAGGGWNVRETTRLVAAAFVPFGGFLTLRSVRHRAAAAASAPGSATAGSGVA